MQEDKDSETDIETENRGYKEGQRQKIDKTKRDRDRHPRRQGENYTFCNDNRDLQRVTTVGTGKEQQAEGRRTTVAEAKINSRKR